jgi:hypothetical protein
MLEEGKDFEISINYITGLSPQTVSVLFKKDDGRINGQMADTKISCETVPLKKGYAYVEIEENGDKSGAVVKTKNIIKKGGRVNARKNRKKK